MENQPTRLDKAVKISIIAGALIFALSIAYCLVIFLPQKEKVRVEQQQQEKKASDRQRGDNELSRADCLARAEVIYYQETKVVPMYSPIWDRAEKTREADQENCYKQYPQQ